MKNIHTTAGWYSSLYQHLKKYNIYTKYGINIVDLTMQTKCHSCMHAVLTINRVPQHHRQTHEGRGGGGGGFEHLGTHNQQRDSTIQGKTDYNRNIKYLRTSPTPRRIEELFNEKIHHRYEGILHKKCQLTVHTCKHRKLSMHTKRHAALG